MVVSAYTTKEGVCELTVTSFFYREEHRSTRNGVPLRFVTMRSIAEVLYFPT